MPRELAEAISAMLVEFGHELSSSLVRVQEGASPGEFGRYQSAVSKLMVTMLVEVMNPIYEEHPDLKPKDLD